MVVMKARTEEKKARVKRSPNEKDVQMRRRLQSHVYNKTHAKTYTKKDTDGVFMDRLTMVEMC